ncbi:uncharacterized protein LOC128898242 [Dryobates pubescens]|uniref:uncharacterized protein LOC128898242 n=1 Tax=Dryobates pubescens TaxID=118200 RepID=UPI0023B8E2BC|nr:uncharacterized protein LOC128898242 [Dryobates pubescens]
MRQGVSSSECKSPTFCRTDKLPKTIYGKSETSESARISTHAGDRNATAVHSTTARNEGNGRSPRDSPSSSWSRSRADPSAFHPDVGLVFRKPLSRTALTSDSGCPQRLEGRARALGSPLPHRDRAPTLPAAHGQRGAAWPAPPGPSWTASPRPGPTAPRSRPSPHPGPHRSPAPPYRPCSLSLRAAVTTPPGSAQPPAHPRTSGTRPSLPVIQDPASHLTSGRGLER